MVAGICAAVRFGDGRHVDTATPQLEHVVGPAWARRVDRRAALITSGQEMGQRPFLPALKLEMLGRAVAAEKEKPALHGVRPIPTIRYSTRAAGSSPRLCCSMI